MDEREIHNVLQMPLGNHNLGQIAEQCKTIEWILLMLATNIYTMCITQIVKGEEKNKKNMKNQELI